MLADIQIYLEFLNELCATGTPIRKVLVDYMISEEYYSKKILTETKRTLLNPVLKSEQLSGDLGAVKESIDDFDENG